MTKKFTLLYNLSAKAGSFTKDDVKTYGKENDLCDAYVFMPIIRIKHNGKQAIQFQLQSFDGYHKKPMTDGQLFEAWAVMGGLIAQSPNLTPKQCEIARFAADCYKLIK